MSDYILVSFCNISVPTTSPVLCIKIPAGFEDIIEYAPVTLGFPGLISTATGIAKWGGYIFVVFASNGNFFLSVLRQNDLLPVFLQQLSEVKDGHSIVVNAEGVYVVSTGTDNVIKYNLDIVNQRVFNPQIVWQASASDSDTHHVNSIVEKDGELFVSAFGLKEGNLWSSAQNGYVHNITKNIPVKSGIYHPHSISVRNEQLYYCESLFGSFCSLVDTVFYLDGYTRGVSWLSDQVVCTATSIGRKVSKSTGIIGNPNELGESIGHCAVSIRNIADANVVATEDLSWYGSEIYDVLKLRSDEINMLYLATRSQIKERELIQQLVQQVRQKDQSLQEILNSKAWKMTMVFRRIFLWLLPINSFQERLLRSLYKRFE